MSSCRRCSSAPPLDPRVLLAFFGPVLAVVGAVYAFERARVSGGTSALPARPTVRAVSAAYGNTIQIGIPMVTAIFGEAGLAVQVTIVSLHALIILTLVTVLAEVDIARARHRAGPGGARLRHMLAATVRNTVVHPVVLPVLFGLAWNLSGLALPPIADDVLALLSQGVVPVCLLLIGLSLAAYGVRGAIRGAIGLAVVKLCVLPLVVLVFGRWGLGLAGLPLGVVVLTAALPVGSNALIFAQRYETLEAETSTASVLSTIAFVVTAPVWLALLHALG